MLRQDLAQVYTFADNRGPASAVMQPKRAARTEKRGIWPHRFYLIVRHEYLGEFVNPFQLMEGSVVAAAVVGGRSYLHFDADWRHGLAISVAPRDMPKLRHAGIDPTVYYGGTIRVRG